MKKKTLLTAVSIVAVGSHASGPIGAATMARVDAAELAAYEEAVANGSPADMQRFLMNYPASRFVGSVFGQFVEQARLPTLRQPAGTADIIFAKYEDGGAGSDSAATRNSQQAPTAPRNAPATQQAPSSTSQAQRTLDAVTRASGRLQSDISRCSLNNPVEEINDCLGLALSYYATSLSSPRVVLPPQLKPIPKIVVRTARAVRTAPTAKRAREAVQQAITEIRKQVQLLQVADDSAAAKLQVRAGNLVAASLDSVSDKLRQAEL